MSSPVAAGQDGLLVVMTIAPDLGRMATLLHRLGLSTSVTEDGNGLHVRNPIAAGLAETVKCIGGSYRTEWDYEIGQMGDEAAAANRLAFLLGVPAPSHRTETGPDQH